ncbi:MAG: phage tail protein [Ruminococcus sp.]|nr:phage tail protein [Ruminococcus sp.]
METWHVINNKLTHDELPEPLTNIMTEPYPPFWWYVSIGRLVHPGLAPPIGDVPDVPTETDDPYIHVYDMSEPQDGFDHNGLAVLDPTACTSEKEFNGRWDIELTHPMDNYNKWHWLIGQNVLKVKGQLFRIDEVENVMMESGVEIYVHAKHISYDLADVWIEYSGIGAYNKDQHEPVRTGKQVMDQLMYDRVPDTEYQGYTFDLHSDISISEGELSLEIRDQSYLAALIGADECFINRIGGELYRDNFFLSLNEEMQNSRKESFVLRYGSDMSLIKQKIDFSQWVTYLKTENNYNDFWSKSYSGMEWAIHHHKQKRVHFNYPERYGAMENLASDGEAYWQTVSTPKVTYEISFEPIKNDPKYKDFLDLQNYEVGDTGWVYCEELQINTLQKIIAIKRNELTDEIIKLTLGNMQNSILRPSYMGNTISSGNTVNDKQLAAVQEQVDDMTFVTLVNTPIATVYNQFLVTEAGEYILYKE